MPVLLPLCLPPLLLLLSHFTCQKHHRLAKEAACSPVLGEELDLLLAGQPRLRLAQHLPDVRVRLLAGLHAGLRPGDALILKFIYHKQSFAVRSHAALASACQMLQVCLVTWLVLASTLDMPSSCICAMQVLGVPPQHENYSTSYSTHQNLQLRDQ